MSASAFVLAPASYVAVSCPDADDSGSGVWVVTPESNGERAGVHIRSFPTHIEADEVCIKLAMVYSCRACPIGPALARGEVPSVGGAP